ncbi:MAG: hypothetical protein JRF63_05630, partial [Deltaproteobacteria bacterium]|nr:hypothetical protein [Deltaproteobacteria bacterium]
GQGPWRELAQEMIDAGVTSAIAYEPGSDDPWVLVRREQGMTDFGGRPITERDVANAALRVSARSTHFGGIRLDQALNRTKGSLPAVTDTR